MIYGLLTMVITLLLYHNLIYLRRKTNTLSLENLALKHELANTKEELIRLERIDPLTDILNRNRLDIELQMELARIKRSHKQMGVILIGVDNLKSINKTISHSIGDYLLKEFSELLKKSIRKTDIFGRWWGDKFLIICMDTEIKTLKNIAEKLRKIIENNEFVRVGHITASFGLTISENIDDELSIINRADTALASAKNKGKNRVSIKTK